MHFKAIRPNAQHGWHDIMLAVVLQTGNERFIGLISEINASMPDPRLAKTPLRGRTGWIKVTP